MTNRKKLFRKLILLPVLILLIGCWEQNDIITISKNGDLTFRSDVVVTDKSFTLKQIEDFSSKFKKRLVDAGWNVRKKWISKEKPYKLRFTGSGNLKKVNKTGDFYELKRTDDNKINIRFIPEQSEGKQSSRSIVFEKSIMKNDATVLDPNGKPISEIKNVLKDNWYTIILE